MVLVELQAQDVMAVARQGGLRNLDDIDTTIVERNGSMSILLDQCL